MESEDDDEIKKKHNYFSVNLESLSIEELNEYIYFLEDEIKRTHEEISNKNSALGDANAIFK